MSFLNETWEGIDTEIPVNTFQFAAYLTPPCKLPANLDFFNLIFFTCWIWTGLINLVDKPFRILKLQRQKNIFRVLTLLCVSLKLGTWVIHHWLDFLLCRIVFVCWFDFYIKWNLNVNIFVLSGQICEAFCLKSEPSGQCAFQPEIHFSFKYGGLLVLIDGHINEHLYDKRAFSGSLVPHFCYLWQCILGNIALINVQPRHNTFACFPST